MLPNKESLKKKKIEYLLYHTSTEGGTAGFLANHLCKWLPAELEA
jgi:hypothetical protein